MVKIKIKKRNFSGKSPKFEWEDGKTHTFVGVWSREDAQAELIAERLRNSPQGTEAEVTPEDVAIFKKRADLSKEKQKG